MKSNFTIRVLTVSDIHQSKTHYRQLAEAVDLHRPDLVACVGDVLDALEFSPKIQFTTAECSTLLAGLPVRHLVFARGNHEDSNWTEFVAAWPHDQRPLNALYGTTYNIGPLCVVGFPCFTGTEFTWCAHLVAGKAEMKVVPVKSSEELPIETNRWLPMLMRRLGTGGRALWLMHEPPISRSIGSPKTYNRAFGIAVERFSPRLVICGHDHISPFETGRWHERLGSTVCVNVGQQANVLHYAVADVEFRADSHALPTVIHVQAFPRGEGVSV